MGATRGTDHRGIAAASTTTARNPITALLADEAGAILGPVRRLVPTRRRAGIVGMALLAVVAMGGVAGAAEPQQDSRSALEAWSKDTAASSVAPASVAPAAAGPVASAVPAASAAPMGVPAGAAGTTGLFTGPDPLDLIVKGLLVAVALYATLRVLRRVQGATGARADGLLNILESRTIGPKTQLHLVAVGERRIVVGQTPQGLVALGELDAMEIPVAAPLNADLAEDTTVVTPDTRRTGLPAIAPFASRLRTMVGGDRGTAAGTISSLYAAVTEPAGDDPSVGAHASAVAQLTGLAGAPGAAALDDATDPVEIVDAQASRAPRSRRPVRDVTPTPAFADVVEAVRPQVIAEAEAAARAALSARAARSSRVDEAKVAADRAADIAERAIVAAERAAAAAERAASPVVAPASVAPRGTRDTRDPSDIRGARDVRIPRRVPGAETIPSGRDRSRMTIGELEDEENPAPIRRAPRDIRPAHQRRPATPAPTESVDDIEARLMARIAELNAGLMESEERTPDGRTVRSAAGTAAMPAMASRAQRSAAAGPATAPAPVAVPVAATRRPTSQSISERVAARLAERLASRQAAATSAERPRTSVNVAPATRAERAAAVSSGPVGELADDDLMELRALARRRLEANA